MHVHGHCRWHTDPSGTYVKYEAKSIGAGSEGAQTILQEQYHKVGFMCAQSTYGGVVYQLVKRKLFCEFPGLQPAARFRGESAGLKPSQRHRAACFDFLKFFCKFSSLLQYRKPGSEGHLVQILALSPVVSSIRVSVEIASQFELLLS